MRLFFSVLPIVVAVALTPIVADLMDECTAKAEECDKDPANSLRGPVCGTDNQTYRNLCSLIHAECQSGSSIQKKTEGHCNDPQPCLESLKYAQQLRSAGSNGLFTPRCRPDGLYAAVQCQEATVDAGRYCWCVTPQGLPVPDSTVRTGRPLCAHKRQRGKSKPSRRYSRGGGGRKVKQGCRLSDKKTFNLNLIKIFKSEWTREVKSKPEQRSETEMDRIVLDWKFSALDTDSNDILAKAEYQDLIKIVKKNVKPKRCAKLFSRTCDLNRDQNISRQEWTDCLSRNAIDDSNSPVVDPDTVLSNHFPPRIDDMVDEDEDVEDLKPFDIPRHPGVLQSSAPTSGTLPSFSDEGDENPVEGDCLYDRRTGLNEQQSNNLMYVPECTSEGRFKKVQCYSGYCWCVQEDSGKVVPGTYVKNTSPKCELAPSSTRMMKGCPENRKVQFLKDLVDHIFSKMGASDFSGASRYEKAATWSFNHLDKNRNKILERKEWKMFRSMVAPIATLRHCGKKLPRYCDINKDKRITVTEWNNCLGVTKSVSKKGPNPLEFILKSD